MFQHLDRILGRTLLVISLVMATSLATQASDQLIHDIMKKEIGPAFKIINTDLKAGQINEATKQAALVLVSSFTKLQNEVPESVPDQVTGGNRSATPEDVQVFQSKIGEMIEMARNLQALLKAGNVSEAAALASEMNQGRREGHDRFKRNK